MAHRGAFRVFVFASALATLACGSEEDSNDGAGTAGKGGTAGTAGATGGASGSGGSGLAGTGGTTSEPGVSVTPKNGRVDLGGRLQFDALVTGLGDSSVTWSVREGTTGGSVSDSGLYSAPSTSGTFHVVATSNADSSLSDSGTVTVSAPAGTPPVLVPGVWTEITPPADIVCCLGSGGNTYGVISIAVDPGDPLTLYAGIAILGIWKSTDGGSTWARLGSVENDPNPYDDETDFLDTPINIAVDPADSQHLYVTDGVDGNRTGFWTSNDGGLHWVRPQGFADVGRMTTFDITNMAIDPTDFRHVLLTSHGWWAGYQNAGVLETKDGGDTWAIHPPLASWPGGTNAAAFLYDPASNQGNASTWLVASIGYFRTTDSGENWTQVSDFSTAHGGNSLYYSKTGVLYSGSGNAPLRSTDNGVTWEQIPGFANATYYTVTGDGDNLYTMVSGTFGVMPWHTFMVSPETDGLNFTAYNEQTFSNGPIIMAFDRARGIMYAASWEAGLLALKIPE